MVALLVLFTIVACLVADGIVVALREKDVVAERDRKLVPMESMVFAQDGGESREFEGEKDRNIPWEDVESGEGAKFKSESKLTSRKEWGKGREG